MSVIQSTQPELRYTKRQNLENEARIIGNYYRDIIRSYGVDCIYHKLNTEEFGNFKKVIDKNTILKHAYGYNMDPDYSLSAHTLTYMEVENDIFQLNKFGLNPNADVNFYFENNDFACALATKLGQFKEYPIKETEIECEVPECVSDYEEYECAIDEATGKPIKQYLSSNVFPYELGLGYKENYFAENLSGKIYVAIDGYELDKETTVICHPYEHTDFDIKFDSNSDLYKNLKHVIENDDYLETLIYLTYKVKKIPTSGYEPIEFPTLILDKDISIYNIKNTLKHLYAYLQYTEKYSNINIDVNDVDDFNSLVVCINQFLEALELDAIDITTISDACNAVEKIFTAAKKHVAKKQKFKYILSGKIHGSILFYDIYELGKYVEKIHPAVGDIITIDFPDEKNRERYEITDCFDKQLTQDGISPLLHKYIWKCKARRYVNSYEDGVGTNEADDRLQEKIEHQALVTEEIAKSISIYDDEQDAAYGGYELEKESVKDYDKQDLRNIEHVEYEGLPEGQLIDIQRFSCGSRLCTDGYELIFITANDDAYVVAAIDRDALTVRDAVFECGLKWLKATKSQLRFINIEGTSYQLAANDEAEVAEEMNLDNLYEATIDTSSKNSNGDSFIKFKGCKTYLYATENNLYAKLESNKKIYQLI